MKKGERRAATSATRMESATAAFMGRLLCIYIAGKGSSGCAQREKKRDKEGEGVAERD